MVVELTLVFSFVLELRHLLQTSEHGLHNAVIRGIDNLPDLKGVRTNELRLYLPHIRGEEFDEWCYSIALLASKLRILNRLNKFSLGRRSLIYNSKGYTYDLQHDGQNSNQSVRAARYMGSLIAGQTSVLSRFEGRAVWQDLIRRLRWQVPGHVSG